MSLNLSETFIIRKLKSWYCGSKLQRFFYETHQTKRLNTEKHVVKYGAKVKQQLTDFHFKCGCRRRLSLPILNASSCRSISGQRERDVLYQRRLRPVLWETSSSCSSSQLSTWFMEMWAISRPAPQSSPDELVPSARVTVICFLHWTIFIHAHKLNLPCFEEAIFSLPSSFSMYDLLDNYRRCGSDTEERTSQNSLPHLLSLLRRRIWVISRFF